MPAKRNIEISKPALLNEENVDTSQFIKVVVELPNTARSGKEAERELYNIDPNMALSEIVADICLRFGVTEAYKYSLLVGSTVKKYVTDDSLRNSEIQNGMVICLGTAPERLAEFVIKRLHKGVEECSEALIWLERYSADIVFNRMFFTQGGMTKISDILTTLGPASLGRALTIILACIDDQLIEFRDFCLLKSNFAQFLISQIAQSTEHPVLQKSLNLLERGLSESTDILDDCFKLLTSETYIQARLGDKNEKTQLAALTFTNVAIHRVEESESEIEISHLNKLRQIVLNQIVRLERSQGEMLTAVTNFQNLILSVNYHQLIRTKERISTFLNFTVLMKIDLK